ncbi:MAG TPA: hypothetical protein DCZ72_07780, partial [Armatimonadetes bacterium]|nr:hypothetical protein [Armatimonadota bacterium]
MPSNPPTADARREMLRRMMLARRFDERLMDLFGEGLIGGTAHAACGQEAAAIGVCAALRPGDQVTSTHRGHGHLLGLGGCPRKLMAELFGRVDGYSRGRGGSQHVAAYDIGFLGSNGITAGGLPIATGAALALHHQGTDHVVAAFLGDGATGQGAFHEALNVAAAWKLPIVYACENNLYAMGTALSQTSALDHVAERAAGFGMRGVIVDGQDVDAVYAATDEAVARARAGEGPTLLECKTYRYFGHSKGDRDRPYRTREEEHAWTARDPISLAAGRLVDEGLLDEASLDALW